MDLEAAERLERSRVDADALSWLLRMNHLTAEEVDRALGTRMGLRPLDYEAMGAILDNESSPLGPVELGHRLGISTGSATELVDRLERAGHVVRERSAQDRRRVLVTPHPNTVRRVIGELTPLLADLDELATAFTPEEQEVIGRYLRAATEVIARHAERMASAEPDKTAAARPAS